MGQEGEHFFYGYPIYSSQEQKYIQKLLRKYKDLPVNDDLKNKIWEELQMEKYKGNLKIPFSLSIIRGEGLFPDYIEVLLDNKV